MANKTTMKRWWQLNSHFIAWMTLVLGMLLVVIGSLGAYFDGREAPLGISFISGIGAWSYWALLLGSLAIILGGYYVYDHIKMIKEFNKLISDKSRAHFLKNLDRLEELAFYLGNIYEQKVLDKKDEYKLK